MTSPPAPPEDHVQRHAALGLGALLLLALGLRLGAAQCDLWLDEIWSLDLAARLRVPLQAYGVKHDNNHILNTAWLVLLGPHRAGLLYRLPGVVLGTIAVWIAGALAARTRPSYRLPTVLLLSPSMLLVTHASEARGYTLAICLSLLSLLVLERHLAGDRRGSGVPMFWACTVAAALAHLSAVTAYAAIALYGLAQRLQQRRDRRSILIEALSLHLVPALALTAHFAMFVRGMKIGGGAEATIPHAIAATASLTLGLPAPASSIAWTASALVVGLIAFGLFRLIRARDVHWVLFTAGIGLPVLAMFASQVQHAAPRYLLMSVTFFLLLSGQLAGSLIDRGGVAKLGCWGLLICVFVCNAFGDVQLLRFGRGQYRRALEFMVEHSPAGPITITSDHDFRNRLLLAHHARNRSDTRRFTYFTAQALPASGARWLILHRMPDASDDLPAQHVELHGVRYDRALALPCAPTAGLSWYLYLRRAPGEARAARSQ